MPPGVSGLPRPLAGDAPSTVGTQRPGRPWTPPEATAHGGQGPVGGVGAGPPTTVTKILSRQGPGGFAGLQGFVGGGLVRQLRGPIWVGQQRWADSVPGPEQAPHPIPADRVGRWREACVAGPPLCPPALPKPVSPAGASSLPCRASLGPGPALSAGVCHRELLSLSPFCAYGNN